MKKISPAILILSLLLSNLFLSCKSLPEIEHPELNKNQTSPFINEKYQLTHSIKADLPNGDKALLIGVTVVDPVEKSINAVIMSVEGIVIFDVTYKDNISKINRSMPGFDKAGFAAGLTDDLKLIYFKPDCDQSEAGRLENKDITRYKCEDGTAVDILMEGNMVVEIYRYSKSNSLVRTVNLSLNQQRIPEKIELMAHGLFGYSLYMNLINAEKL